MLDALGVVSAVLVQMTTHVQAQIGSDGCKVEHQALPGAILHVLVVGCAVHLLDVAVDAHLVQHVGNGRQHIGHAADGDNVGGKTIGITSLCQQGLCLLRIIGKMIQAVVVGGGTGNCPLVGHLCHAHQECCVDGIHIDGVAQGAADTGIGPGAVNGTVGNQTQTLDTHAVLVIFLDVDACTVQLLQDGGIGQTYPVHIVLVGLESSVCGAGLSDKGHLHGIQIGQALFPVILVLGIDSVGVVLELAQLEGAGAAGSGIQAAGVLQCLGAHVVDEEAHRFQRGGVGLCHHHLDVGVINDLTGGDVCGLGAVVGLILLDVALDSLGIEGLTVGEIDALPQSPGNAQLIGVHIPLRCQIGDHIALGIIAGQSFIRKRQVVNGRVAGGTGGVTGGGNGAGIAQAQGTACLGLTGCYCTGSSGASRAGCGGTGRAAARGQCQGRCRNAHSLEEVPTRDTFHSGFSFLSFLFLRSSARFCVCRAFVVFSLTHRKLFQLPKNRN